MDPPKPIKDEIKQIWNNPNQGFGLLGLGLKKLAGGLQNTILGPVGSSKVQNEDLQLDLDSSFSSQNAKGVAPIEDKSNIDNIEAFNSEIQKELKKHCRKFQLVELESS